MKSKFIFEPSDFKGSGQMVVRQSSPIGSSDISFMASVAYKIGWLSTDIGNSAVMISLTDGMVLIYDNKEKLCHHLNKDEQGYRPMTKEEIISVMSEVGNRF